MKTRESNVVLKELDNVIVRLFDELELGGRRLTQQEKLYGLSVVKQTPGIQSIVKAVRENASEADANEIARIVREEFFASLRGPLLEAVKSLPHPRGGRKPSLTAPQKKQLCGEIGVLMGDGLELKDAVERMAQKFDVSARTVYRVWQKRAGTKD